MRATAGGSTLYFITLLVIGNYFVLNLFVAILLSNLRDDEEERQRIARETRKRKRMDLQVGFRL